MTQQVLARKWRPKAFQDLVGQDHVRKALGHALDTGRLHHAYLFTGTRGVGKTTIARILARCLNCETGITATPCGVCGACTSISENRFVDLIEVDAASRTKVDDTRELLENVSYAPTMGRYKIYLIDEVHMLTTQSFNALLKTLEEPPAHVIFLLATTDPHKLLPTVLSRCLQFHLRDLSADQIQGHLAHILDAEGIAFEVDATWHLARAGRGSMRDALTLLDQAIAFGQGALKSAEVVEMLGVQGISEVPALLSAMAQGQGADVLAMIQELAAHTPDWMALVAGVQSTLHQVAIMQIAPTGLSHLAPNEQRQIEALAQSMSPEFVQLAYQFSLTGYRDLPMASDPKSAFEMLVLRMLAFRPARAGESPPPATTRASAESTDPEPHERALSAPEPSVATSPATSEASTEIRAEADADAELPQAVDLPWEPSPSTGADPVSESTAETAEPSPEAEPSAPPSSNDSNSDASSAQVPAESLDALSSLPMARALVAEPTVEWDEGSELDEDREEVSHEALALTPATWVTDCPRLGLHGMTASLAHQMALVEASAARVVLALLAHTERLLNESHRHKIKAALAAHLDGVPEIQWEVRDSLPETPEGFRQRREREALAAAQKGFQADPVVRLLIEEADATVRVQSIQAGGNTHV